MSHVTFITNIHTSMKQRCDITFFQISNKLTINYGKLKNRVVHDMRLF